MERLPIAERHDWRRTAEEHGFAFHSPDQTVYWDESACYRFTLAQIENDLEDPAEELERMCFAVVERAVGDDGVLARLAIPEAFRDHVAASWRNQERNLYGRMDFAYDGHGPAKLYEYNADTPTALYESAVFQWVWLEQAVERGIVPKDCDQFNSLHERLVDAFGRFGIEGTLHLACARDSDEDRGTVEYLEDCARQAGLATRFMFMEDIGLDAAGRFVDLDTRPIETLFKLYPWEWLMAEEFGRAIPGSGTTFIEPAWKSILSNKGLLPLLWEMFEGHPNLLPAYFADDPRAADVGADFVRKPLFSREGANIEVHRGGVRTWHRPGPYGAEGHIVQAYRPPADFGGRRPIVGVWLVASQPAGACVREDDTEVTTDAGRFVPHVILD